MSAAKKAPDTDDITEAPAASVHPMVVIAAEWAWRLLVVLAALFAVGYLVSELAEVVIPVALALLGAALLSPVVDWLQRKGIPRSVAVVVVLMAGIGFIAGILTFVIEQFIEGLPALSEQATASINKGKDWLADGPLHFSQDQLDAAGDNIVNAIQDNKDTVTSGALTTATTIGHVLTGALLSLFTLIFFLYGGTQIWEFVTRIIPKNAREKVRVAGSLGFGSLVGYVRATVAVAMVDALGIGAGLAVLQVPLALPLASLVFVGAFVPIIGAFLTGFVAVFIALVTKGLVSAVITFGIVVGVMQLEGHVLQPLLLGRAVRIHPLAVVLAIATGILLGGIIGGLLAVPIVAVLNTAIRSLLAEDQAAVYAEVEVEDPHVPLFPATPDPVHPKDRFVPKMENHTETDTEHNSVSEN
ncbi:MAG: AI-2E family transporter [Mycobacteriaceae bacterium]